MLKLNISLPRLEKQHMHFNIIFFLETTLSKESEPYVCTLVSMCVFLKENTINRLEEMFVCY